MRTPFFGPGYVSRTTNLTDCRCVNLYPEVVETRQGKDIGALYLTPGLTYLTTVGSGPIRGLHVGTQKLDNMLFVASGNTLYVLNASLTTTALGTIGSTFPQTPVNMVDNGLQLFAASGNKGFAYSGSFVVPVNLPFSAQPISVTYQDGFGLINQAGSDLWWSSNLNDLTTWSSLDFASADTYPDDIVGLVADRREIYVVKRNTAEIWYNVGTPNFAFGRNQGVLIEHGTCAANSIAKSAESLFWLEQNNEGLGVVIQVQGFQARRVSTHGLENLWATYPTLTDATAYCYQQNGHNFYVLTFPSGDATWVYDVTTSNLLGIPCWHQRAATDSNGTFHKEMVSSFVLFNNQNIVGDTSNGNLYLLDPNQLLNWTSNRTWLRSWRALPQPIENPTRFNSLRVDMETGFAPNGSVNPLLSLTWSDDGGHTWANGQTASAGMIGQTALRVLFHRLGSTRRNSGLDRIFQLSSAATFNTRIIGAELQ